MTTRILRFSWLAAILLVPLASLSQTPQTTTPAQPAAVQTASPAQPTASVQEAAARGLKSNLHIHIIDQFTSQAVQASPGLTCKQLCLDELDVCIRGGGLAMQCKELYEACVKKC